MVGINPARRRRARCWLGVPITSDGIEGLLAMDGFEDIAVVFDATSTWAHIKNDARLTTYQCASGRPNALNEGLGPV